MIDDPQPQEEPTPPPEQVPDRTIEDVERGVVVKIHKNPKTL